MGNPGGGRGHTRACNLRPRNTLVLSFGLEFDILLSRIEICYPWEVRYRAVSRIQGTVPEATMSVVPNQGNSKITVPELLERKSSTALPLKIPTLLIPKKSSA